MFGHFVVVAPTGRTRQQSTVVVMMMIFLKMFWFYVLEAVCVVGVLERR